MKKKQIHYNYAIFILCCIIISISALAYFDTPNLVDKFSFALTLSSLLLAILAIFYTIISAHKQDSHFTKIIEATTKLTNSTDEIEKASTSISLLTKDMPLHFQSINSKIDNLQNTYKALSENEQGIEPDPGNDSKHDSRPLKGYISKLHFSGMAILYLFVKASYKGKVINYEDFQDFKMAGDIQYAIGLLNGFETTGLIDFKIHKDSIVPTHCDKILYTDLRKELDRVIAAIGANNNPQTESLKNALDWVDNMFTSKPAPTSEQ